MNLIFWLAVPITELCDGVENNDSQTFDQDSEFKTEKSNTE